MRLAKYLLALALTFAPMSALANTVTIPNTFQNGQFIDANLFNQNFQSIATFANGNIDNTNIGDAGIYGSQIKPTTVAQATFGGTVPYTFAIPPIMSGANINANTIPNGALVTTPLTTLTAGSNITLTGSAPNITISAAGVAPGVTSVTGSGNIASSGGATPNITISNNPTFTGNLAANGSVSAGGSVFANNYWFAGNANVLIDNNGTTTQMHAIGSVGNSITFVNGPNTAYAPIQGGPYTNLSDRRFKRNITPYTRGLDTIMGLKPVHFIWREDNKKSMGFIAQDVQKILPEIVSSNKLQGKPTLGVNYSAILAPLVAAVQEQQREIVDLRAEIKALKQTRK